MKTVFISLALTFFFLCMVSVAQAQEAIAVKKVTSPLTFSDTADKIYLLEGIRVPEALQTSAQNWLTKTIEGQTIIVMSPPDQAQPMTDRWGRMRVHATGPDKRWLQAEMVAQGLALVDIAADYPVFAQDLLARENAARTARKGLWATPDASVYRPETINDIRNRFLIVEGRIHEIARRKDVTYINFGADWKTDFTLRLTKDNARAFLRGFPQDALRGGLIRVRGWVYERNGPMIDLLHSSQLEFLSTDTRTPP